MHLLSRFRCKVNRLYNANQAKNIKLPRYTRLLLHYLQNVNVYPTTFAVFTKVLMYTRPLLQFFLPEGAFSI